MKWNEMLPFVSQCGIGAMIVSDDHVVAINDAGKSLLGVENYQGTLRPGEIRSLQQSFSEKQYAHVGFEKWIMKAHVPEPEDLDDGEIFIAFRDASSEIHLDMYQNILNRISESIILCDEQGQILFLNDAAVRMDSLLNESVVGKKLTDVYHSQDHPELLLPKVIKEQKPYLNKRQHYETYVGKEVDIMSDSFPIYRNGQILGAYSVMEDFTQIDSLHRKIIELQDELLRLKAPAKGKQGRDSVLHAKFHFDDIISTSACMKELVERCQRVAVSSSSVLIYGETGTGKELFAQSIHNASPRANGPFLAINCAAIPENLLEGLLFGTEKGAYTGAEQHPGLFEQADGGTLLLDEINSMNINLQPKLLRVLQEGTVRRVGGLRERKVDVRVLSIMNIPPRQALEEKKLRSDLFFRLGVVDIRIPPLRERKEDIPFLVKHFIEHYNRKLERNVQNVDKGVMEIFQQYDWPGNVRELQHAIEYAMNMLPKRRVTIPVECLPEHFIPQRNNSSEKADASDGVVFPGSKSARETLRDMERTALIEALRRTHGNISAAARELGMSRQNLQYHIKRDKIKLENL
jgi:arginine utilization regulatory protein